MNAKPNLKIQIDEEKTIMIDKPVIIPQNPTKKMNMYLFLQDITLAILFSILIGFHWSIYFFGIL